MSENLSHWEALSYPPADMLKKIGGGRLSGMTDIKPQWRYRIMTEIFGPCGIGWKFTVTKQWLEDGDGGQKVAFVNVDLFVKIGDAWSDAIPGNGGSMFIENEQRGPHTCDEAFKMATTDALSVAMKMIGVGAAVYMGEWTGSKYKSNPPALTTPTKQPAKPPQQDQPDGYEKVLGEGLRYIGLVNDVQGANSMVAMLASVQHIGTSKADLWKALQQRAAVVGAVWNAEGKAFEAKQ